MADAYAVPAFDTTGRAGWDQYASLNQVDRSAMTQRGHPDTTALPHLSWALYIPRHDSGTTHMAIHDISTQYEAATHSHSLPIGSSRYTVALGLMAKPSGDGIDGMPVLYDVDFNRQEDGDGGAVVPLVRCREHSSLTDVELYVCIFPECPVPVMIGINTVPKGDIHYRRHGRHHNYKRRKSYRDTSFHHLPHSPFRNTGRYFQTPLRCIPDP